MPSDRTLSRVSCAFVVAGVLAIPPTTAGADNQGEFHCAKPGTRLVFNNQGFVEFIGQEGFACLVKVPDSKSADGTRTFRVLLGLNSGPLYSENHAERLFPFKVGNEIEFDHPADSSHLSNTTVISSTFYHDTIRVIRQEKLVTKAGTFDTWVVEHHQDMRGKASGTWVWTYWWAPDVGYMVKKTDETRAGYGTNQTAELTSITTPQPAAQPTTSSTSAPPPPVAVPPPAAASNAPSSKPSAAPAKSPTPGTSGPGASSTTAQRLQELKDLLDRKLITPSEYEAKRKAILNAL